MRALAEYVMKGRTEAVIAAVLATGTVLFAWVGGAVVALVTLRKGPAQGSKILAWAMLPALAIAMFGDTAPLTILLGAWLAASVLRATESWPLGLIAAVVSGLIVAVMMATFGRGYIEQVLLLLSEAFAQMMASSDAENAPQVVMPSAMQVAGLLGLSNAFTVIMCLILGRWWQAMLYNPGGFRQEFHSLRLTPPLTVSLLAVGLALSFLGMDYKLWALILALPFVFAGFGLIHSLAARKGLSGNWLGLFYFIWLLLDPVKTLVVLLAVADSWFNFRARMAPRGPGQD